MGALASIIDEVFFEVHVVPVLGVHVTITVLEGRCALEDAGGEPGGRPGDTGRPLRRATNNK